MQRLVVLGLGAAVLAWAAVAGAQIEGTPADGRSRLRERYDKPRSQQKLDEAIRKFGDEDVQTRLEGVEGLGENTNDPKAVEYLVRGAADGDLSVRVKSIDVIGDAKVKAAVPLLVQQLFMRDTTLATKQHIVAALGKVGDTHATKPILDFLAQDVEPNIRASAIYALGDLGDRSALPTLQKLKTETKDGNLRGLIQAAIRRIEEKPAPTVVPPALAQGRRGRPAEDQDEDENTP